MKFIRNKKLKNYSTFCIGGTAEYFIKSGNIFTILKAINFAETKNIPWYVFGGGSNVLFPDKKIQGLLICFSGGKIINQKNEIIASAGVPLQRLVDFFVKHKLRGFETLAGIPGNIGGAIYGNAGAYGCSISENVSRVEVYEKGKRKWFSNKECKFSYRESIFKNKKCIILQVAFYAKKGEKKYLEKISKKIMEERLKKYPPGLKCPGSFFKNPLVSEISHKSLRKINLEKIIDGKIPAGYLLEEVGAKGMQIGSICISHFHGNLLLNIGNGTEKQVKKIASILKRRVKRKFGILLHEEVQIW